LQNLSLLLGVVLREAWSHALDLMKLFVVIIEIYYDFIADSGFLSCSSYSVLSIYLHTKVFGR